MTSVGLAALPDGGRVDFTRLRARRRQHVQDLMTDEHIDVLVLGRPASIAHATGVRALWTSGSRPFSPSCVIVRADRRVHLLATWDEGVPDEIPHHQLFGLSWNPAIAAARVREIPGLADAKRIGVDGTSVSFRRLIRDLAPDAEIVDVRRLLEDVRAPKSEDGITAVETACALAEAGLEAMHFSLAESRTPRQLLAVLAERLGSLGAPVLPNESVAFATAGGFRTVVDDEPLARGQLVALAPSASYFGHEGTIARTVPVGGTLDDAQRELGHRCRAALDAVIGQCVPGTTGEALLATWRDAGGGDLPAPLIHGVGLGTEPPLVDDRVGHDAVLVDGMVLAVQSWIHDPTGGWLERDVVAVSVDGPRTLTRWSATT